MARTRADEVTHGWRHDDAAFIVHLAEKCGWSIRQTGGGDQARMYSESGAELTIPSNQSLKASVFRSWVGRVWTHRSATPTAPTVGRLIKDVKLDPWHTRQVWTQTGLTPPREEQPIKVPDDVVAAVEAGHRVEAIREEVRQAEAAVNHVPEPAQVTHSEPGRTLVSRVHPVRSFASAGRKAGTELDYMWERTWSDGTVDYECAKCGFENPLRQGVLSHQRKHADQSNWAEYGSRKGIVTKAALKRRQQEREQQQAERERRRVRRGMEMLAEAAKVAEEGYPEESPLAAASREVTEQQQAVEAETAIERAVEQIRPDGRPMLLIPARQALGHLQQILELVAPLMVQQMREMHTEVTTLQDRVRELESDNHALREQIESGVGSEDTILRLAEMERRAIKAEGDLDALRDLLGVRREQ